ncbi:hypothetical protein MKX03_026589, partial [Papaver bracteatum]
MEREGKTMPARRRRSFMRLAVGRKERSESLHSTETDYSNPLPDGSKCLRSRIVPP